MVTWRKVQGYQTAEIACRMVTVMKSSLGGWAVVVAGNVVEDGFRSAVAARKWSENFFGGL